MKKAFTLIELMIVVAIIAVIAAIAIPNLVASKVAANESATVASMRAWLNAQNIFHRTDHYSNGGHYYANADTDDGAKGFTDMYKILAADSVYTVDTELKLIDITFARASKNAKSPYSGAPIAKAGYWFHDIEKDPAGTDYDYAYECGVYSWPAKYGRTGRKEFVMNVDGTVYEFIFGSDRTSVVDDLKKYPNTSSKWLPAGTG